MAHEQDEQGEAFTEADTSRRQHLRTPICRASETPGGSQWEEWVSADDPGTVVIPRYPTRGRHAATVANFRSSARAAFRSGVDAGPSQRQRDSWQRAATSNSRLPAAPPAAAHQLTAATSSPLLVDTKSRSPSPASGIERLTLQQMSPRALVSTVRFAGQCAAADALEKNRVGGNALLIYLANRGNAQVTSRPSPCTPILASYSH